MNDMRLPGVVPFSADTPAGPGAQTPRDPAEAFDAVMSRYANAKTLQNPPAPAERARNASQNDPLPARTAQPERNVPPERSAQPERSTPAAKTKEPAPDKSKTETAPASTPAANDSDGAHGKPAARSKPEDGDADDCATTPTVDAQTLDAATLAALAARNTAATVTPVDGTTQPALETDARGTPDGSEWSPAKSVSKARAPLEALTGRVDGATVKQTRTIDPQADGDDTAAVTTAATARRGALPPKDTLRIDAPLMRAMEVVQTDFAQRSAANASTLASTLARTPVTTPATAGNETISPLLAATLAATSTAAPATGTYSIAHSAINAPVGTAAFADELSQRVVMFAGQKLQRADIAVTPADLGPIAVSIEVRGQEATLAFAAASAATRAAIEDALPRLRDMLSAQGLQLAGTHVGGEPRRDAYRPARGDTSGSGARRSNDGVAAVATTDGSAVRRRVNLIDIEV